MYMVFTERCHIPGDMEYFFGAKSGGVLANAFLVYLACPGTNAGYLPREQLLYIVTEG